MFPGFAMGNVADARRARGSLGARRVSHVFTARADRTDQGYVGEALTSVCSLLFLASLFGSSQPLDSHALPLSFSRRARPAADGRNLMVRRYIVIVMLMGWFFEEWICSWISHQQRRSQGRMEALLLAGRIRWPDQLNLRMIRNAPRFGAGRLRGPRAPWRARCRRPDPSTRRLPGGAVAPCWKTWLASPG